MVDHIFTNLSSPQETSRLPSQEKFMLLILDLCAFVMVAYFFLFSTYQSLMAPSIEHDARVMPFGLNLMS